MNSSSERLVVFVTPAQKRVLAARAARMGVSLSELVRRAVLAYDDTGPEVRAAGLVDRLAAASEAGRDDTLRRLVQAQAQARVQEGDAGSPLDTSLEFERAASRDTDAPDLAQADGTGALPVAAAVARALIAQAEAQAAQHGEQAQAETEALVARVVGSFPQGSV